MRRSLVLALGGIAALGAAGVAGIAAFSRDALRQETGGSAVSRAESPVPGPAAPVTLAPAAGNVLGWPPSAPVPPPSAVPAAPPPQPDSWEAVDPVASAEDLGPIGPAFAAALGESFAKLGQCFEEVTAARYAASGAAPSVSKDSVGSEMRGPPVLMLEFETMSDAVRIVDAPVGTRGTVGDGVILCAQSVLRGMRIGIPGARPGERYRMRYTLVQ